MRGSLQVSHRDVNWEEMRMKTLLRLTSSTWIKNCKESGIKWFIPSIFKTITIRKGGKFPGIVQSLVHKEA